jgi:hypothetical protein
MQIALASPARKRTCLALVVAAASVYIAVAGADFTASWLAGRPDLHSLQWAERIDRWNAEYAHRLGRYFDLVGNDPVAALAQYNRAIQLNPHDARYWLDLANSYQLIGDTARQAEAIEKATFYDSKTPEVAWEAANLYLVQGQTDKALQQFRTVMEGDSSMINQSLQLCWRIRPDIDVLLRDVVPPRQDTYEQLLTQMMQKNEAESSLKAWQALYGLHEPMGLQRVFDYIRFLLLHKEVDAASRVWQQATAVHEMSAYLPSSNNLIVNGSFSLPVVNGGFDWQYRKPGSAALTLDPSEFHSGQRSLAIGFDGSSISDADIYQVIAVQANTTYEFSGYYKSDEIEGAGGPCVVLQDVYSGATYYQSEELKDGQFWKNIAGEFTTGPETRLLVLHVLRLPAASPISGKLWLDDLRLVKKSAEDQS